MQVGTRIEEFAYSYVPAYGDLARANIRSLEQGDHDTPDRHRQTAVAGRRQPANALRDRYEFAGRAGRTGNPGRARLDPGADRQGAGGRRAIDAQSVREPDRCHQRRYTASPRRRDQAPAGGARRRRQEGARRGNGARRRTPRRPQPEARRHSGGHAGAAAPGRQHDRGKAAAGDADLHRADGAGRHPRPGVRRARQHRRHPSGAAVAGGRAEPSRPAISRERSSPPRATKSAI